MKYLKCSCMLVFRNNDLGNYFDWFSLYISYDFKHDFRIVSTLFCKPPWRP